MKGGRLNLYPHNCFTKENKRASVLVFLDRERCNVFVLARGSKISRNIEGERISKVS